MSERTVSKMIPQRQSFEFRLIPGEDVIPAQGEPVRASPDDLSSPSPIQADPLLQVQQTTPRGGESQPDSAEKTDTEADGKEWSGHKRAAGGERCRVELEKDGEDDQAAGEETVDEALALSKGSHDGAEEEHEDRKEPADANNNSMETPQNCQENFITIPEITEHVSVESGGSTAFQPRSETQSSRCFVLQVEQAEETYCSDGIEVVLADNSGPGPASSGLDDRDTVKIIITMSCDPQTAAQLEESVKQRLLENTQVRGTLHSSTQQNHTQHLQEPVSTSKAQTDAEECHIKIPVITFDSPEEEMLVQEEGDEGSEDNSTLRCTTSQSEAFHLCREAASSECSDADRRHAGLQLSKDSTGSPQLSNPNSSSGIDGHSQADNMDAPQQNTDSRAFLRLPPTLARYGPGGRTHIRGLSMDSGKDAVLLSHHTVC